MGKIISFQRRKNEMEERSKKEKREEELSEKVQKYRGNFERSLIHLSQVSSDFYEGRYNPEQLRRQFDVLREGLKIKAERFIAGNDEAYMIACEELEFNAQYFSQIARLLSAFARELNEEAFTPEIEDFFNVLKSIVPAFAHAFSRIKVDSVLSAPPHSNFENVEHSEGLNFVEALKQFEKNVPHQFRKLYVAIEFQLIKIGAEIIKRQPDLKSAIRNVVEAEVKIYDFGDLEYSEFELARYKKDQIEKITEELTNFLNDYFTRV